MERGVAAGESFFLAGLSVMAGLAPFNETASPSDSWGTEVKDFIITSSQEWGDGSQLQFLSEMGSVLLVVVVNIWGKDAQGRQVNDTGNSENAIAR